MGRLLLRCSQSFGPRSPPDLGFHAPRRSFGAGPLTSTEECACAGTDVPLSAPLPLRPLPRAGETVICDCCGSQFRELASDPRLPLLRIDACSSCRTTIAGWVGWAAGGRGPNYWERGTEAELHRDIPKARA